MNEPDEKPRNYKWPWAVAVAVIVGIILAVIWVAIAARKVERERDYNAPLPGGASTPAR